MLYKLRSKTYIVLGYIGPNERAQHIDLSEKKISSALSLYNEETSASLHEDNHC